MNCEKFFDLLKVYDISGFTKIRLGKDNDGGYIVAEELIEKSNFLFSFGVGDDISFEKSFLDINSACTIKCFDPYIENIEKPFRYQIQFYNSGVGIGKRKKFFPISKLISNTELLSHHTIKIDIEGSEFDINVDDIKYCDQLIIELHLMTFDYNGKHTPYFTELYKNFYYEMNEKLFLKYYMFLSTLLEHFTLFHIHGNNSLPKIEFENCKFPPLLELTLINNNLIDKNHQKTLVKNHNISKLDMCNKTDREDFKFLFPFKISE